MRMCTKENSILHNGQQPDSAVNSFTDLGKFEARRMLSGRLADHKGLKEEAWALK